MRTIAKIARYEALNHLRGRWLVLYGVLFFLVTEALFRVGGGGPKVVVSLSSVVLFVVPLIALVLGTLHVYNAREFTELMLSQPVERETLFAGLFAGLAVPLCTLFVLGIGAPFLWHGVAVRAELVPLAITAAAGVLLTLVCLALAFLLALAVPDKTRGLGLAVLLWLALAVLYDGFVLLLIGAFSAYPLEKPLLALMLLNPIDLARVVLLLELDISALMGYTGAVFRALFGSSLGVAVALAALAAWAVLPLLLALRIVRRRDF